MDDFDVMVSFREKIDLKTTMFEEKMGKWMVLFVNNGIKMRLFYNNN